MLHVLRKARINLLTACEATSRARAENMKGKLHDIDLHKKKVDGLQAELRLSGGFYRLP